MQMEKINTWKEGNEKLEVEMDRWRENYICRNNCSDWKKDKFCNHLVNAREMKFKKDINRQLSLIMGVVNGL